MYTSHSPFSTPSPISLSISLFPPASLFLSCLSVSLSLSVSQSRYPCNPALNSLATQNIATRGGRITATGGPTEGNNQPITGGATATGGASKGAAGGYFLPLTGGATEGTTYNGRRSKRRNERRQNVTGGDSTQREAQRHTLPTFSCRAPDRHTYRSNNSCVNYAIIQDTGKHTIHYLHSLNISTTDSPKDLQHILDRRTNKNRLSL